MIEVKNVTTLNRESGDFVIPSRQTRVIQAEGMMMLPGLIDPHVHFRTPGMEHKEDWQSGARAAIHGGYTTVFDMPNTIPPTITQQLLHEKQTLIDSQLKAVGIPLRYELYFGADKNHLAEISTIAEQVVGVKVFMGCSTGNLVIDDDESLHAVFEAAAKNNLLVAVHAEDEALIKEHKAKFKDARHYCDHSVIRDREVAARAVEKAISLSKRYGTRLYVLHASTHDEITLIKQAKAQGLNVFAETTPHHLFLDENAYEKLQGKAVVNPPLRTAHDREALWDAVRDGVIDTIGSDHAPHLPDEKARPYGECPSGMPGIETTLPLLYSAHQQGLLSLDRVLELTCLKAREIFNLPANDDVVLIDMNNPVKVQAKSLNTRCGWSAFEGRELTGWPRHVVLNGTHFDMTHLSTSNSILS